MERIKTVNLKHFKCFQNSERTVVRIKAVPIQFNLFHFQLNYQLMINQNLFPFCKTKRKAVFEIKL